MANYSVAAVCTVVVGAARVVIATAVRATVESGVANSLRGARPGVSVCCGAIVERRATDSLAGLAPCIACVRVLSIGEGGVPNALHTVAVAVVICAIAERS